MSHGPAAEGSSAEPNLTPLLDVVLQLLMFFMMCVNFVTEQIQEGIKLPVSQAAKPIDKTEGDVLFINLKPYRAKDFENRSPEERDNLNALFKDGEPVALVVGEFPKRPADLRIWLKQTFADAQKNAKDGKVKTAIILRAHEETNYQDVYDVMTLCKVVGYSRLKLRATTQNGPQS
jgi:biopolymer transport protein ExbD